MPGSGSARCWTIKSAALVMRRRSQTDTVYGDCIRRDVPLGSVLVVLDSRTAFVDSGSVVVDVDSESICNINNDGHAGAG